MESGLLLRRARRRAGLSQRELAERAGTSHATIAAYETGAKVPRVDTLDRILRAAGYDAEVALSPRAGADREARDARGRELYEALELAAHFPMRVPARHLPRPVIGRGRSPRGRR
jgi:transcriptional regulator with XRE-family HTH domain